MAKARIVYVTPGENIEVRVCDPAFELPSGAECWRASMNPHSFLIGITGWSSIQVTPDVHEAFTNRQMLPARG